MKANTSWFQQGLGTRIDALEVALRSLETGEADAASTIHQLALSLMAPASRFGFHDISEAATVLADGHPSRLPDNTHRLIEVLRSEAAKARRQATTVLVIGGNEPFSGQLSQLIATDERDVLYAPTAVAAQDILHSRLVVFIVLNLILPDLDGRTMLIRLRENPLTASIPVLVLAEKTSNETRRDNLFLSVEAFLEQPVAVEEVAVCIKARLRRSHESRKEAHRDPLTGLLNRAACREHFVRVLEACRASREPLAFAILSIDGARDLLDEHGVTVSESVVQRVASHLSRALRATDILARWGIYEFAALFPGEDQFGGTRAIDKIRKSACKESFKAPDGSSFKITLSSGVALASSSSSIDGVIADADRFLFQARSNGGNRIFSDQSWVRKRKERILAILQDSVTADVLEHLFEKEGFDVVSIDEADAGIATASGRQRFHLILLQDVVSERDGFEVLTELRRMPRNNRVPIVMLISRNSPQSIVLALELGASDYVIMPFSPLTFMNHMRRLLTRGTAIELGSGHYQRILLVDTDTGHLLLAASALHERGGFLVHLAKDADSGLQRLDEEAPDAVMAAMGLTTADGQDFLKAVLATPKGQNVALIIAGNASEARAEPPVGENRIAGFITKPINPLVLGEDVERILGLPPNVHRAPDANEHLNNEIQRVLRTA